MATQYLPSKAKLMFANISDEVFNKDNICLVVNQNSISLKNFGRCSTLAEKYTYGDVAGTRKSCPHRRFCCREEDQSQEGDVHLKSPPLYTEGPAIATLITQFGIGGPIEENDVGKNIMKRNKTTDKKFNSRLAADTLKNRVGYFNRSIYALKNRVTRSEFDHIKKIIIPAGIARSGEVDDIWLRNYFPIISCSRLETGFDNKLIKNFL